MVKEVLWHLPGFGNKFDFYEKFIEIIEQFPEVLNEGHKIHCVYGCPPGSIWNGGRPLFAGNILSKERIQEEVKFYNSRNISIALTWSNLLLTEKDLYDRYCNMVTECCSTISRQNYIITSNHLIYDHIKNVWSDRFKMILSVTRNKTDDVSYDLIPFADDQYDLQVLHEDDNPCLFNSKYLSLPYIRAYIEILVNQCCVRGCRFTNEHYKAISRSNLDFSYCDYNCKHNSEHVCPDDAHSSDDISYPVDSNFLRKTDVNILAEKGFKHFKIEGRLYTPGKLLDTLIYYLIKDENKIFVRELFGALK